MPKVVIGIHGLGNKPPKVVLQRWWLEAMYEGLKRINKRQVIPRFELVYWADIIYDKPLDINLEDPKDPYYIDEKYVPAPVNYIPTTNRWLRKLFAFAEKNMDRVLLKPDLSMRYLYISDYIIKRYFSELDAYFSNNGLDKFGKGVGLKELIRHRLMDALKKYEGYDIMLVAHSMGSIIAYDTLSILMPDFQISTFITIGSPLGIPSIISKIATNEEYQKMGLSVPCTPAGVAGKWYNFSDLDDRIAFDHTLNDDYAENVHGVRAKDIPVFNNYVMNGRRNPHKSWGYLRAPEFARVLYKFVKTRRRKKGVRAIRKLKVMMRKMKR